MFPTGLTRILLDLLVPVYHNLGSTIILYFVQKIVFKKLKEIINIGTYMNTRFGFQLFGLVFKCTYLKCLFSRL